MDIREKTLTGLIAIFIIVTIVLLSLSQTIFLNSYRAIESRDVTDDMNQILANVNDDMGNLASSASDWGPWDDLYAFALGKDPAFVADNLQKNTYQNLHLDFIIITNSSGAIVYGGSYNFSDDRTGPLPADLAREVTEENSPLRPANASPVSGFLVLSGTTALAASYPVLHSDLSGPPAGTLVMGRYLNDAEIQRFGLPSEHPPSFSRAGPPGPLPPGAGAGPVIRVFPVSEGTIGADTTLRDIGGVPALIVSYEKSRNFYQQGKETIQFFILVMLATMGALGIFTIYRVDRSVLARLTRIIDDTKSVSDGTAQRIRKTGTDEIAELADAMNRMIERLELSHTALKDSEEKFRAFVRESTDGYVLIGSDGEVIEWNAASERITGIPRTGAIGRPVVDILVRLIDPKEDDPAQAARIRQAAASVIGTGEYERFYEPLEIEITRPDGTKRTLQLVAFPVRTSAGRLFGMVLRDITESIRVEKALTQSRRKLSLLNTVTFQDIRSSVFALAGYHHLGEIAGTGAEGADLRKKEELVLRQIEHALRTAKDFQDLGINPPRWHKVNEDLVYALSHLDTSQVSRTVSVDGLEVFADPLLEKAFYNLFKFALGRGGVTAISVTYRNDGTGLLLLIGDNGAGIPPGRKAGIFDREERGSTGLFLVREILSITGMTIAESGAEGEGARFVITVPEGMYRFGKEGTG